MAVLTRLSLLTVVKVVVITVVVVVTGPTVVKVVHFFFDVRFLRHSGVCSGVL